MVLKTFFHYLVATASFINCWCIQTKTRIVIYLKWFNMTRFFVSIMYLCIKFSTTKRISKKSYVVCTSSKIKVHLFLVKFSSARISIHLTIHLCINNTYIQIETQKVESVFNHTDLKLVDQKMNENNRWTNSLNLLFKMGRCFSTKMKLYQSVQRSFAILGIYPNQFCQNTNTNIYSTTKYWQFPLFIGQA